MKKLICKIFGHIYPFPLVHPLDNVGARHISCQRCHDYLGMVDTLYKIDHEDTKTVEEKDI